MSDTRSIRLAVEVPGTAQEAWAAIATAAGISSWYVPHTLEERQGGMATARFGAGDEMLVPGRVAAWEPPRRIVFDGGEASGSAMTFQWTVQPVGDDRCEIELLNEGYGSGGEWDDQFAAMHDGWEMFLTNLRLHMENFRGRTAAPAIPSATWPVPRTEAWELLLEALGLPEVGPVGHRLDIGATDAPALAGTITEVAPFRISLLVERPAAGTGFITAEGTGGDTMLSVWTYLYGPRAEELAARDEARWNEWLRDHSPAKT